MEENSSVMRTHTKNVCTITTSTQLGVNSFLDDSVIDEVLQSPPLLQRFRDEL